MLLRCPVACEWTIRCCSTFRQHDYVNTVLHQQFISGNFLPVRPEQTWPCTRISHSKFFHPALLLHAKGLANKLPHAVCTTEATSVLQKVAALQISCHGGQVGAKTAANPN